MSRAKFEEWLYSTFEPDQWQFINTEIVYKGWLAGRESMRDEAANACEGFKERNASSIAAKCSQEIRKIKP